MVILVFKEGKLYKLFNKEEYDYEYSFRRAIEKWLEEEFIE